jgi:D-alanyl-D-alanine carboxypeptidase/D-alanyl-D-alanine carboxypeptidase (penicillin-binding protein 5/6)
MASTTKIMTGILAIESGRLSETVTIGDIITEGSSIGLKKGYELTLEALTYGMLLESGNDAAEAVADFLAGSEENFSHNMNEKAYEIGMLNTSFVTSSGLDSEKHYSTAYDMALLGAYAVENPVFREICSTKNIRVDCVKPDIRMTYTNHNKLLSGYDGVFGIKTGFTKKSGRCLVTACERNGITLIAVTLNAFDDWNDHKKLYDYGFSVSCSSKLFIRFPDTVKIYGAVEGYVRLKLKDNPLNISLLENNSTIKQKIYLPEFIYAPVSIGDVIGKAELIRNNTIIGCYDIVTGESIEQIKPKPEKESIWSVIKNRFYEIIK